MSHKALWQGRTDTEDGKRGERWHQVVQFSAPEHEDDAALTLIGYPNDAGVAANKGRTGASGGPNTLRGALASLPWMGKGALVDAGDSAIADTLEKTQTSYAKRVTDTLNNGSSVIGLGGGHDIAWGSFQGVWQANPDKRIGIINIDAHLDLRKPTPLGSSGTPFRQIHEFCERKAQPFNYCCIGVSPAANTPALFDYALQSGTRYLLDTDFSEEAAKALLTPMLAEVDVLYLTICMDAFPAGQAPGVSAPAALGICPAESIRLLRWIGEYCLQHNIQWAMADIAELNPSYDQDNRTARLAARFGFELSQLLTCP